MIKNYLLIAVRNLKKNLSYVLINTFGLGIALACCITAYLLLAYNIEFDHFHDDDKVAQVYSIHAHFMGKDGKPYITHSTPLMLAPTMADEIAGVESYTRYINDNGYVSYGDNAFAEGIAFADSNFFKLFDFPLQKGSVESFRDKKTVIISHRIAEKYFAKEDPIGKLLVVSFQNDKQVEVMVGGVLEKVPLNTTFYFDALMRFENYTDIHELGVDRWDDWRDPSAFVKLASVENAATVNTRLGKYVAKRNEVKKDAVITKFQLDPFKANFTQDQIGRSEVNHRMSAVPLVVFTAMAGLILLIACFNLTNTSIAMTSKRLKEVGVRKTIGAARYQIVIQFIMETILSICLALVVGYGLAQLIVPAFTRMWNLPYGMDDLSGLNLFVALIIMVFLVAILAGIYPALANSKFNPVALLRGRAQVKGATMLSRSLVSMQFAISVIVLIAGVVFIQNTHYQEEIKFGYDKEKVINVSIQSQKEFDAMENEIRSNPKIVNVAVTDHQVGFSTYQSPVVVDTTEYNVQHLGVGKNYFEAMGFTLIEGRYFNHDNVSDIGESAVVNRAFLAKAGIDKPLESVVAIHGQKRHIIGVIENHIDNLYRSKDPEPFVFYPTQPQSVKLMIVRVEPGDIGETQKYLEATWKKLFPTKPFQARLQEDVVLKNTKDTNGNLRTIFLFLTALGGILSSAGIFSLASLNIAKRTKEIGIRKTLGASVAQVLALLNKEFVIILTCAAIIGSTLGFYLTKMLLDEIYAYHITIGVVPVIVCALVIFLIGLCTTSATILKAARSNPVKTLRSE
jgi:putative ABC transport system permease protein